MPPLSHPIRHHWPLVLVIALLWSTLAALLIASFSRTDAHVVYALDDPYIHMAMAKNLAVHGVWGVTSDGFTSSSSSIAWTAMLAALFRLFGVRDAIPLAVNGLLATVAVGLAYRLVVRRFPQISVAGVLLILALFTFATPLPALVFVGQEHILHLLVTMAFVFLASDLISGERVPLRSSQFARVAALAFLLPLLRYEGLYPVLIAALILGLRRRPAQSIALVCAALAPVLGYAAVSLANGWWVAPNSVLLKGNVPNWRTAEGIRDLLGYAGYSSLLAQGAVAFLVYAAVALYAWLAPRNWWGRIPVLLVMFVMTALLHLQYSQPPHFWLFRYEAYLVGLGILVVSAAVLGGLPASQTSGAGRPGLTTSVALGLLVLISPLTQRAVKSAALLPQATANIYEQQYQMGRFLATYYPRTPTALNDIGAPTYLGDVILLDLVGLASMDIARVRRARTFSEAAIAQLADEHDVRIAIVYDSWFRRTLPRSWVRAGSWRIRNPIVVGSDTVTFYATRPVEYPALVSHLREFERQLPATVISTVGR